MCLEIHCLLDSVMDLLCKWGVTFPELLTTLGLLLDLYGIYLLTLLGIFGNEPFKTYYRLTFETDRDELPDKKTGGTYALSGTSVTTNVKTQSQYDRVKRLARRQSVAVLCLVIGFFLQIVGTLL